MAKTVTLTVNVDDTQFRQFVARFNAFSNQIKNLNTQFTQINANIQKASASSNALLSTMKALWQTTKSLTSTVAGITTHFIKWSVLIAGIGAMLGMGGGLFGIERLASSILQKRRMVLGLGGDFGRTQAALTFGRGFLDSPQGVLEGIQRGLGGSPEQMRGLQALGVPFGTKLKPEDVLPKIIDKLHEHLRGAIPGTELMVAERFGAQALGFSDMDIMRIKNMSERERKEFADKIIQQGKEMNLSEKAQKAWADLEMQFKAAKTQIETIFGEKLADLAKPLEELSKGFVELVRILINLPVVEEIIKALAEMLKKFSDYLKSEDFKKDLENFTKEASKWIPSMKQIREALESFADILTKVKDAIGPVLRFLLSTPTELWQRFMSGDSPYRHRRPGTGGAPSTGTTTAPPATDVPPTPPPPGGFSPPPPGGWNVIPPPEKQGALGGTSQLASFLSGNQSNTFGGTAVGGSSFSTTVGGTAIGGPSFAGVGGSVAGVGGSTNVGIGGNTNLAFWQGAAQRRVPGPDARGIALGRMAPGNMDFADIRNSGPLDINNWQMDRTASLTIRNVPGANVFASANGMG
jgi:hypothetical protein